MTRGEAATWIGGLLLASMIVMLNAAVYMHLRAKDEFWTNALLLNSLFAGLAGFALLLWSADQRGRR